MSNVDRAADVIDSALPVGSHITRSSGKKAAKALAGAGLLMPDLPAPSQKLLYGDSVWKLSNKAFVSSWVDEAGPMVELSVGRGRYATPTEAREIAYMLLAAAQRAEREPKL